MDISSSASTSYGSALMTANLAKKQQLQDGETALKLLQTAAQPAQAPVTSATGALGSNINIHV